MHIFGGKLLFHANHRWFLDLMATLTHENKCGFRRLEGISPRFETSYCYVTTRVAEGRVYETRSPVSVFQRERILHSVGEVLRLLPGSSLFLSYAIFICASVFKCIYDFICN